MPALQSLLAAGGFVTVFALLTLAPRWVQVVFAGAGLMGAGALIAHGVIQLDAGVLLGGLMLLALFWGLDAVLVALRRPVLLPGDTPGGANAPGASGERAEGRSPSGIGVSFHGTTAERAGRSCAFSDRGR